MKVLFLTSEVGLRGGERQLLLLAREMTGLGLQIGCVAPRGAAVLGGPGLAFRAEVAMANDIDPRGVLGVWRAARAFAPDVCHAFTARAHALAALAGRAPLVVHRTVSFAAGKGPLGQLKYRRARRYIAVAPPAAEALRAAGVPADVIRLIPNAIDVVPADRSRARAALGLDGGRWIGTVAYLERGKAIDDLVCAARGLDAGLCVVGEGPERPRLESLARDQGVRAAFAGGRDGAAALVAAFDAFALPSRSEGLPLALLEAMAAGVPAVATRVGGVPEALAGGAGWLVEPGDVDGLHRALVEALADRAEADRRAARARDAVRTRYAPRTVAERVLAVYREVARPR